jgi:hypothetical protein
MFSTRCPECDLVVTIDGEERPPRIDCPGCGTIFGWDPDNGELTIFYDESSVEEEFPEAEETEHAEVMEENRLPAPLKLLVEIEAQERERERQDWRRRRNTFLVAGGSFLILYLFRSLVILKAEWPGALCGSFVLAVVMGFVAVGVIEGLLARAHFFARFGQKAFGGTARERDLEDAAERLRRPPVRRRPLPSGDEADRTSDENITPSPSQGTIQPDPKPEEPTDA